ncbi:MAG: hypothetical protein ABIQ39_07495 [Ilumatobacteraceae bacterium]
MSWRRVAGLVVLLSVAAACGSDLKVATTTESHAGSTTEAAATTTAPPATAPSTTAPPTTVTPSSTTSPDTTYAPMTTAAAARLTAKPLGIDAECTEASCISARYTLGGELVTFDSATSTLTFTESGHSLVTTSSLGEFATLVLMGPDDVAYLSGVPPEATDPVAELIAVSTTGATAGKEVARVSGLDGSGDSVLISTRAGVMQLGCCGFEDRLPVADAPLAMAWVTPLGEPSGVIVPEVHLEHPGGAITIVVRTAVDGSEVRWTVPAVLAGRDMPPVAATDDGGALVWMYDGFVTPEVPAVLYDLRPDGTVDTFEMGDMGNLGNLEYVASMHSSRVLVAMDSRRSYVRVALP